MPTNSQGSKRRLVLCSPHVHPPSFSSIAVLSALGPSHISFLHSFIHSFTHPPALLVALVTLVVVWRRVCADGASNTVVILVIVWRSYFCLGRLVRHCLPSVTKKKVRAAKRNRAKKRWNTAVQPLKKGPKERHLEGKPPATSACHSVLPPGRCKMHCLEEHRHEGPSQHVMGQAGEPAPSCPPVLPST